MSMQEIEDIDGFSPSLHGKHLLKAAASLINDPHHPYTPSVHCYHQARGTGPWSCSLSNNHCPIKDSRICHHLAHIPLEIPYSGICPNVFCVALYLHQPFFLAAHYLCVVWVSVDAGNILIATVPHCTCAYDNKPINRMIPCLWFALSIYYLSPISLPYTFLFWCHYHWKMQNKLACCLWRLHGPSLTHLHLSYINPVFYFSLHFH